MLRMWGNVNPAKDKLLTSEANCGNSDKNVDYPQS